MNEDPHTLEARASLTSGRDTWSTVDAAGIPSMVLSDGPHGVRRVSSETALGIGDSLPATCYPPAVSLAASWDDDLIHRVGAALGREASALGVSVLLGPGINIKRSPLGGRNFEYASEDPLVAGRYGAAFVRGVQSQGVAATPKHFAANNQETDRLRVDAIVDERALREIYLAAFERVVVEARPWALMTAYNRVNGVYASEDPWLLTDLLRGEWGFDGLVMSDWGAVWDRVAAVRAGLDLEMPPSGTDAVIVDAVAAGTLDPGALDRVVERTRLLAERTAAARRTGTPVSVEVDSGHELAREAARASAVLLRNDGVLPLSPGARLAVIGELARIARYQGGGSSHVHPTRIDDLASSLTAMHSGVSFAAGYRLDDAEADAAAAADVEGAADRALVDDAVAAAAHADVAIVCVGLPATSESEGFDRQHLRIPSDQLDLVAALATTGTPLVVVVSAGGVVDLAGIDEHASALVHGGLLGQAGGSALVELLTGEANFTAKLTETIPRRLEDSPSHPTFPGRDGAAIYGESIYVGYRGLDARGIEVAYPFGHGESYTSFAYSDLRVEPLGHHGARVEVAVTNTGARDGAEIVQFYVGEVDAVDRPVRELRDYVRVDLAAGATTTVRVELAPRAFSLWDVRAHRWSAPAGTYRIEVGASSRDIRLTAKIDYPGDAAPAPITRATTVGELRRHPHGAPILAAITALRPHPGPIPPELMGMVDQSPLVKLTGWTPEITGDLIDEWIARANAAHP